MTSLCLPGKAESSAISERHGIEFPDGAVMAPADLVQLALDGIEAGEIEILDPSAGAKASLAGPPHARWRSGRIEAVAAASPPVRN